MSLDLGARLRRGPLLLDGAMGTELLARGLPAGLPPEAWNLDRPELVREVHRSYLEAGCEVVLTNTFGANSIAWAARGRPGRALELARAGAALAREAVGGRPGCWVAGSIGPIGPGPDPARLDAAFAELAAALAGAGVDFLAIETMLDLREARVALRAARRVTGLPVTVCMSYEAGPDGSLATRHGDTPGAAARALAAEGATAVGANCSLGSGALAAAAAEPCREAPVPVVAKPSAGLPVRDGDRLVYRQTPDGFAADVAALVRAGAAAVGGCCGTDPRFLAALRARL